MSTTEPTVPEQPRPQPDPDPTPEPEPEPEPRPEHDRPRRRRGRGRTGLTFVWRSPRPSTGPHPSIIIGIIGLAGILFTAMRFGRDDTTTVLNQQATITLRTEDAHRRATPHRRAGPQGAGRLTSRSSRFWRLWKVET